jgi:type I restriction enzyme S subunit
MCNPPDDDWTLHRLQDIAQIVSGGTPSRDVPAFWNGSIPWVTPTDITRTKGRVLTTTQEAISELGLASCSARLLPPMSILMTSRATVGEARLASMSVCTNQGFKCLIPKASIDELCFYYQLINNRERYKRFGIGSTFLEVSKKDTENFTIILPKRKTVQRTIALMIASADDAIEQAEALIEKMIVIKVGMIHDLFTRGLDDNGEFRPARNEAPELYRPSRFGWIPCKWNVGLLGDFSESLIDGPFGSNLKTEHYTADRGVRVVRLQNIQSGCYDDSDKAFISERHAAFLARNKVVPGDVLIAGLGDDSFPVGRACCYPDDFPPAINKADCFRLRCKLDVLRKRFAMHSLNAQGCRHQVERYKQGVTRQRINTTNFKKICLPLPQLEEQDRICSTISSIDCELQALIAQRSKLNQIKAGMLSDLLSGRVPVRPISSAEAAHV